MLLQVNTVPHLSHTVQLQVVGDTGSNIKDMKYRWYLKNIKHKEGGYES